MNASPQATRVGVADSSESKQGGSEVLVALFPGQGSLKPGMGLPWVDHPSAALLTEISDIAGIDVRHLLCEAPADELVRTDNAQLATFSLSMMVADALESTGVVADLAIGHSLGEYSALRYARILTLEAATHLVVVRGQAMVEASVQRAGSMAAVLGTSSEDLESALSDFDELVIANLNAPGQVVVSGPTAQLDALRAQAKERGLRRVVPLEVGGAFHSPLMGAATEALRDALLATSFDEGRIEIVANIDAHPHPGGSLWAELLIEQLTGPVRFQESIESTPNDSTFIELGAGGVLGGLVGRIRPDAKRSSIGEPEDLLGRSNHD